MPRNNVTGRPPGGSRPDVDAPASAAGQPPAKGSSPALRVTPAGVAESYHITDLPDSIAQHIAVDPETGEWIWTGSIDRDGYGRYGGEGVHRVIYTALVGPIPASLEIDHVKAWGCTSRACCSPWHMEPVTKRENCLRGRSFAAVNAAKTECDHGHPFDLFNTYYRRDGHRDCRICTARRQREYKQRKRAKATELVHAAELTSFSARTSAGRRAA